MLEMGKGHVVTVASLGGFWGINRMVDYCASKFAAVGFDEALRTELKVQLFFCNFETLLWSVSLREPLK